MITLDECGVLEYPSTTISTHHADDDDEYDDGSCDIMAANEGVPTSLGQDHVLRSLRPGESEIEQLAHRVETKRMNRIPVTFAVRMKFSQDCRKIAKQHEWIGKISLEELVNLRDAAKREYKDETTFIRRLGQKVGFRDNNAVLLSLYERGIESVLEVHGQWFHFQDFRFYHTRTEAKWPWMRSQLGVALLLMFGFYCFTPILFCIIMKDQNICVDTQGKPYGGWLTSLYFASTTMATVGYGDLTIDKDRRWKVLVAIIYMIIAILMAIFAFGTAAQQFESSLSARWAKSLKAVLGDVLEYKPGDPLRKRVRIVKIIRLSEIISQFVLLNLLGVFAARIFIRWSGEERVAGDQAPSKPLTWMDTLYWAVQTTTTIGYGDFNNEFPFDFQWFQIFYLTISTYFVGAAFRRLADLRQNLDDVRRYYAWERREVSEAMIEDMQAYEHDDKIDQYEYAIASLLTLGKVSSEDLAPIMDKFRKLAGIKGFIQMSDNAKVDYVQKSDYMDMATLGFE